MSHASDRFDAMRTTDKPIRVAEPPAVGDRVRFVLVQPTGDGQTATQMQGDGYVMAIAGGNPGAGGAVCFIAVLGYAGVLTIPAAACQTIEHGALVRRLALS